MNSDDKPDIQTNHLGLPRGRRGFKQRGKTVISRGIISASLLFAHTRRCFRSQSPGDMDLYHVAFAVLVITSGFLAWRHHRQGLKTAQPSSQAECGNVLRNHGDPKKFRNIFLLVYCLVMASDWLQVPLFSTPLCFKSLTIILGSTCLHTLQRREAAF